MYRTFVRRRLREAFDDLSAGRVDKHARRFRDDALLELRRGGETRRMTGRDAIRNGLRREFPEPGRHAFRIEEIVIEGGPARTRVAVLWREDAASPSGPAAGMNLIVLRFGRVIREQMIAQGDDASAGGAAIAEALSA